MAITNVQSAAGQGTLASNTKAFPSNITLGNVLIVMSSLNATGSAGAPTDSQGNIYTLITTKTIGTSTTGLFSYVYWAIAKTTGANTVTFPGTSGKNMAFAIAEYSGVNNVMPYDIAAGAVTGGTTSVQTLALGPTGTTWQANEVVCAWWAHNNTGGVITQPTGFTSRQTSVAVTPEYSLVDKVVSATGTQSATFTTTATAAAEVGILFCLQGSGVPVPVQSAFVGSGVTATTQTVTLNNVKLGDFILVILTDGTHVTSFSDTQGNVYTTTSGLADPLYIYCLAKAAGTLTFTANWSPTSINALFIMEYASMPTTAAADTLIHTNPVPNGTTVTTTTPAAPVSQPGIGVNVIFTGSSATVTAGSGWHSRVSDSTIELWLIDSLIVSTASAVTSTATLSVSSANGNTTLVVFDAPTTTGPAPGTFSLMGVGR